MFLKLIRTAGPGLDAILAGDWGELIVRDEFSHEYPSASEQDGYWELKFSALPDEGTTLEGMLSGNPDQLRKLEYLGGTRYRIHGQVTSVSPVGVDCGHIYIADVLHSGDPRLIGSYLAFDAAQLIATTYESTSHTIVSNQPIRQESATHAEGSGASSALRSPPAHHRGG